MTPTDPQQPFGRLEFFVKKLLNWRILTRAVLGIVGGAIGWWYGYYWAGRMFASLLAYDPPFEYSSMQFVSSIAGGVFGSAVCGLILWRKRLFPVIVVALAVGVTIAQYIQQSRYGFRVDYFAILTGFAVVPLLVTILDRYARRGTVESDR